MHGYSLRVAMEVKVNMKANSIECECKNESVIRVRSENAFDSLKVLKFIFYKNTCT